MRAFRLAVVAFLVVACSKKDPAPPALEQTPPPVAVAAKPVASGKTRFEIDSAGSVDVLIDAPLEKFKGRTKKLAGVLDVDPNDLKASRGEVVADLDAFETHTFGDAEQDESQTEHAKNWFELGEKVEPAKRDDYKMARFTIESIEEASATSIAAAKSEGSVRKVHLKAKGDLRVHGRSAKKTVELDVTFAGPPDAPTEIGFRTTQPVMVSLSEHDVKPRDVAGQFLAGALEKVGKKIDDQARVQIEGRAVRASSKKE